MSIYAIMFYLLGAVITAATVLAITRRNLMHAIVYLVLSFIGTALLFYLLGAPFLAVLEVVIYAGAIMVLFLFIVMMLEIRPEEKTLWPFLQQWFPALVPGRHLWPGHGGVPAPGAGRQPGPLPLATASPLAFGRFVFQKYWLGVEIASFLLFVALVGGLYLGRSEKTGD